MGDGRRRGTAFLLPHQPPRCIEQKRAEDVLHGFKAIEERDSGHDEQCAKHDGPKHAVDQRAMLLADGQAEAAEQDKKNKEVVNRERPLEHIAGDEFERALLALRVQHEGREAQRQHDEEDRPEECGAKARTFRAAAKHDKVDDQQCENDCVKADPVGEGRAGDHQLEQISCRCLGSGESSCGLSLKKGHAEWGLWTTQLQEIRSNAHSAGGCFPETLRRRWSGSSR